MKRPEWLWGAAVVALLLAAAGILPLPEGDSLGDSFSEDAGGKRAFYLLASELLDDVRRNSDSLLPPDETADILLLLGPARYPDRAQWQTLHDWVSEGRALVFAARWQDPAVRLEPFGIEVVPLSFDEEVGEVAGEPEIVTELEDAAAIDWRSAGQVRTTAAEEDVQVQLSYGGTQQILWQSVGDGAIVVVASDYLFSNRSLTNERNGVLAFRVLETASPAGPIYFDEVLNDAGAPKVVGILFEPPFRLLTLQLLLVTMVYGWMASRRFGAVRTEEKAARRSLVEHAEALGSLHFRVGTSTTLLASYLEFFRQELGLSRRGTATLEPAGVSSSSSSGSESVTRALRAAKNPHLDRGKVAELIQSLARTRQDNKRS